MKEQIELHEIIRNILLRSSKPLTVKDIHSFFEDGKLWVKPSVGNIPTTNQISARISKHSDLFLLKDHFVYLKKKTKKFIRLTWNENRWEFPIVHKWDKKNQGKSSFAHENQFGFGFEEWLFNPRNNIDGFQYGFIQGVYELNNLKYVDEAVLFSINQKTKDRFLVGKINNIEILDSQNMPKNIPDWYKKNKKEIYQELENVNADYSNFKIEYFFPTLRFKMSDAEILDTPILINELKVGGRFNRFKPYNIDEELEDFLLNKFRTKSFVFKSGKRKNDIEYYNRKYSQNNTIIKSVHSNIINELEKYLAPNYTIKNDNLSIESTLFGENIADIVTKHSDGSFSIYEVKTSNNARYNIREAIGQLLDYALWYEAIKIKELVIVSPSILTKELTEFIYRLDKSCKLNIKYLKFDATSKVKFEKMN